MGFFFPGILMISYFIFKSFTPQACVSGLGTMAKRGRPTPSPSDLHFLAVDLQGTHSEVHPNGVLLRFGVDPGREMPHHTRLPHVGIPDEDNLEQIVKVLIRCPG